MHIEHVEHHPTKVEIQLKNGWKIESQQVLLATNAFTLPLLPDLELEPARNQVLVSQPIPDLKPNLLFQFMVVTSACICSCNDVTD